MFVSAGLRYVYNSSVFLGCMPSENGLPSSGSWPIRAGQARCIEKIEPRRAEGYIGNPTRAVSECCSPTPLQRVTEGLIDRQNVFAVHHEYPNATIRPPSLCTRHAGVRTSWLRQTMELSSANVYRAIRTPSTILSNTVRWASASRLVALPAVNGSWAQSAYSPTRMRHHVLEPAQNQYHSRSYRHGQPQRAVRHWDR